MVHNQFDCQPNNSITMLMVNNDTSLYECFTGDFFDSSADTKEILSSLSSSVPLTSLTLDPVGPTLTLSTDLNGHYHDQGLENSETNLNSTHHSHHHHHHQQHHHHHNANHQTHPQQLANPHQQQQQQQQHHISHHQQHQHQHQQLSSPNSNASLSPSQSPSNRSSSSSSSPVAPATTTSTSPSPLSHCPSSTSTSPSLSPVSTKSSAQTTTTTNLNNVTLPLDLMVNNNINSSHLISNTNTNSNSSITSNNSNSSNSNHSGHSVINMNNVNSNVINNHHMNGNCKYTDYIDGKFDGLMSTFWTMDISKNSPFLSELASDLESRYWESKPPDQWTSEDVWHWIFSWAGDRNIDVDDVQPLAYANMNGQQLCSMSKIDFISMNPKYGAHIYDTLNQLVNSFRNVTTLNSPSVGDYNCLINLPSFDLLRGSCLDLDGHGSSPSSSGSESDRESTSSSMTTVNERQSAHLLAAVENTDPNLVAAIPSHTIIDPVTGLPGKTLPSLTTPLPVPVKKVGRRGRPPKKDAKSRNRQGKGNGKLWEFIRDLLLDPATNPSLIRWERREDGVFKFVQSDKVAKLWGQRKQNPRMTYEKLSRAMRYYYKSQVLLPVFGRRLVYKFGPNATGWRAHPIGLI